jgi:glycerol uptake facilitator-like aquaporin
VRVIENRPPLWRRLVAETLGTGLLVAVVVGSGIAAQTLSPSDVGLQLLENSIATMLGLAVLIVMLSPVSGAHFNPVVSIAERVISGGRWAETAAYAVAQVGGAIGGALLANAMFGMPPALASTDRATPGHLLGEVVATAILVLVIFSLVHTGRSALVGPAVGAYIGAAYWFTSSTSFANPAVAIGRVFSDSFAGIAPASMPPFVVAELAGGALGLALYFILFSRVPAAPKGSP